MGDHGPAARVRDPEILASPLDDAAHFPGVTPLSCSPRPARPRSRPCCAARPRSCRSARSRSLTGGATPDGRGAPQHGAAEPHRIHRSRPRARVQAGVTIAAARRRAAPRGPGVSAVPTFTGRLRRRHGGDQRRRSRRPSAYGTTRDWVSALTLVLPTGRRAGRRNAGPRERARGMLRAAPGRTGTIRL